MFIFVPLVVGIRLILSVLLITVGYSTGNPYLQQGYYPHRTFQDIHTGLRQSPVDMDDSYNYACPYLDYQFNVDRNTVAKFENTGNTVRFMLNGNKPMISGGPLQGKYIFQELHFHWGRNDSEGSEHTRNGIRYPMETHIVHYNIKYGSYQEALLQPDGLGIIGIVFDIRPARYKPCTSPCHYDNQLFDKLARHVRDIPTKDSSIQLSAVDIMEWLRQFITPFNYFTYQGSLTTPPYSEVATWIVYNTVIYMSENQIEEFRRILPQNFRETQPLNGRPVFYCIPNMVGFITDCGEQGGGKRQSPIDINKQNCRPCPPDNTELEFANYWDAQGKATITDTGHTAEVKMECSENVPTMRGGPLNGEYELVQMHFHWGANDNEGSEHTINGRPFSMEAHFVHYKKGTSRESSSDDDLIQDGCSSDEDNEDQTEDEDYGTQGGCSSDEDSKRQKGCSSDEDQNGCSSDEDRSDQKGGDEEESSSDDSNENTIAVLAFFFQVGCSKDNEQFQAFVDNLCRVKKPKDTAKMNVQDLLQVFQEKADCEDYFTYLGSLTTEPYTENVIWIVNPKPIMISHEQVCAFRKLKDTEGRSIKSNHRAVQPLNGRYVFYCSPQAERSCASKL